MDITDLGERQRERLRSVLVGTGRRFEMSHDELWFRESIRDVVERVLEELRVDSSDVDARSGRHAQGRRRSKVRADRRTKEPSVIEPPAAVEGRAAFELAEFLGYRRSGRSRLGGVISMLRIWLTAHGSRLRRPRGR